MKQDIMKDDDAFANHLLEFGAKMLAEVGDIQPMFVGRIKDGLVPMLIADAMNDDTKPRLLAAVGAKLKELGATSYGFVMESWYRDYGPGEIADDIRPSKSERRKEAVTVAVCDETGVVVFKMRDIDRDKDGKPSLGKPSFDEALSKDDAAHFGGAFSELLQ